MSRRDKPSTPVGRLLKAVRFAMALAMLALAPIMLLPPGWFGMESMGPEQLRVRLSGKNPPRILDVRTAPEFNAGHIGGARFLSLHALPFNLSKLDADRDREMVLICLSGHRSRLAGLILRLSGFDRVSNLTGGMSAWRKAGLPVEK